MPEERPERGERSRSGQTHGARDRDAEARDRAVAAARMREQGTWVDLQIRRAIDRGDFSDLPGQGKPLQLPEQHDPDWWVKRLVEREKVVVLPPSVQLRRDDAELDDRLDRLATETEVRREVGEFNDRVRWVMYRPPEGPPLVTPRRDPDVEVERWRDRREERVRAARAARMRADEQAGSRRSRNRSQERGAGRGLLHRLLPLPRLLPRRAAPPDQPSRPS